MSEAELRDELARRHHALECGCTDRSDEHRWPYVRRANAMLPVLEQARADEREQAAAEVRDAKRAAHEAEQELMLGQSGARAVNAGAWRAAGQAERARATIQRVRALHEPCRIYGPCGHRHEPGGDGVTDVREVGPTCEAGHMYTICRECCMRDGDQTEHCAANHMHAQGQVCTTLRVLNLGVDPDGIDDLMREYVAAAVEQARADAWDEGHDAGQHNEHEYRPGRAMTNPYRGGEC